MVYIRMDGSVLGSGRKENDSTGVLQENRGSMTVWIFMDGYRKSF